MIKGFSEAVGFQAKDKLECMIHSSTNLIQPHFWITEGSSKKEKIFILHFSKITTVGCNGPDKFWNPKDLIQVFSCINDDLNMTSI